MAEYSRLVITNKGQALLAKMIAGSGNIEFTKISVSSTTYTDMQLEGLDFLSNVEQISLIAKVTRTNEVAIKVEAVFTNTELAVGYYMRAIGLYAVDPDEGEILYAVTRETSGNCYMPAYNGATVSSAYVQLVTTVGNAENVSLEVDQAAVATIKDIRELRKQIADLEMGTSDETIAEIKAAVDTNRDNIAQLKQWKGGITTSVEQTKTAVEEARAAAHEAKEAVDDMAKNPWIVDGDTAARPLSVVTGDFSTYPASDSMHAYAADAHAVGSLITEDRDRISALETNRSKSIALNKIIVTFNQGKLLIGSTELLLFLTNTSYGSSMSFTFIADGSEEEYIRVAIPVRYSSNGNNGIGLVYGSVNTKKSNTGSFYFYGPHANGQINGGYVATLVKQLE